MAAMRQPRPNLTNSTELLEFCNTLVGFSIVSIVCDDNEIINLNYSEFYLKHPLCQPLPYILYN